MATLQLLLNHYKEPLEIVKRFLDSLESQFGVDKSKFSVLICSDGREYALSQNLLSGYSFKVDYMATEKHAGVSYVRNTLLKKATADFVMICDCDDVFYSNIGMNTIFSIIEEKCIDVYRPAFMVEFFNPNGEAYYKLYKNNHYMIHGAVYRRAYLIDNGIHWDERVPYMADVYFMWQVFHFTSNILHSSDSQYVWKYNKNSVSRGRRDFLIEEYYMQFTGDLYLIEDLVKRGREDLAAKRMSEALAETYIKISSEKWDEDKYNEAFNKTVTIAKKIMNDYGDLFDVYPLNEKRKAYFNRYVSLPSYGKPKDGFEGFLRWTEKLKVEK